jgi:hypothetical protein
LDILAALCLFLWGRLGLHLIGLFVFNF